MAVKKRLTQAEIKAKGAQIKEAGERVARAAGKPISANERIKRRVAQIRKAGENMKRTGYSLLSLDAATIKLIQKHEKRLGVDAGAVIRTAMNLLERSVGEAQS